MLSFAAGQAVLVVTLVSPLNALSGTLLSAHMAQHSLLVGVAPALLLLGRPGVACAWALADTWTVRPCASTLWRALARLMGGEIVVPSYRSTPYSIAPYQTTHNTGGAIMGTDPKTSVVNRYLQSWAVSNVFVQGACAFPQNPGYNPTGTVGALAYWTVQAIRAQYLKQPGPLVR
jgi:choline dehydrogenase-like flavoprotein